MSCHNDLTIIYSILLKEKIFQVLYYNKLSGKNLFLGVVFTEHLPMEYNKHEDEMKEMGITKY